MPTKNWERIRENDTFWFYLLQSGAFTVSNDGTITKVKTGYSNWKPNAGYVKVYEGERYILAHRLAWMAKHGKIVPKGYEINHRNGIKTDNSFSNLERNTPSQNQLNGTTGSALSSKKKLRRKILSLHEAGLSDYKIADELGIPRYKVYRLRTKEI